MKEQFYKAAMETVIYNQFCYAFEQGCSRCTLSNHGCPPIIYRGNQDSDIVLVGEAPGLVEQQEKEPFVGPAGVLLDNIFKNVVGLDTNKDMLLTNCVFCRPIESVA